MAQASVKTPLISNQVVDIPPHADNSARLAEQYTHLIGSFTQIVGDLPLVPPNILPGQEEANLKAVINPGSAANWACACLCCLTGIGCCYVCNRQFLVNKGEYAFTVNNGTPEIYFEGRNVIMSPLNVYSGNYDIGQEVIKPYADGTSPVTIVRVPVGKMGLVLNNGNVELLIPGVHARNAAPWVFQKLVSLDQDLIELGPLKIFIVKSGAERVCYDNGEIKVFREGRYAVNSNTFTVKELVSTQQQNLKFSKHLVVLDGGIRMYVEGLLTFQVVDVRKFKYQLQTPLQAAIENVTEAELTRVFAGLHLEQISSAEHKIGVEGSTGQEQKQDQATYLGNSALDDESNESRTRESICNRVEDSIGPVLANWGCKVINFQLESTMLADKAYALQYEAASLQMAKAKSELRALDAKNQILIQSSQAQAEAVRIKAEGEKSANVLMSEAQGLSVQIAAQARVEAAKSDALALNISANAQAECRKIEAQSRQESADKMTEQFARQFQLGAQEVEFGRSLKANVLTVQSSSMVGRVMASNFVQKS